jgi:hypothetical protein
MTTDALRSQVASKWQEIFKSFNRLNRNAAGISGLLNFSEVGVLFLLHSELPKQSSFRHGTFPFDIYIL